ncbi:MAG: CDP-glycerol glycerophosphotransferase family protein [Bdellovibrionales bacterium]
MDTSAFDQIEKRIGALEQKVNTHAAVQSLAQVSRIYPKTNSVIFVGLSYFGDNIKYAYLAFQKVAREKNVTCAFLTEDASQQTLLEMAGLPYLSSKHPDYLPLMLSAKVVVLHDVFYPIQSGIVPHALLQGAKFIQLWHGIPLKEIGLKSQAHFEIMAACGPFEALVATNASSKAVWAQRFLFRDFAPIGYPRDDVLFREPTTSDMINVDKETLSRMEQARREGKTTILYAPTFRDAGNMSWFDKARIHQFAGHCRSKGYLLCINLHPGEQVATESLRMRYPELQFVAPKTDVYPLIKETDILVTDYSSLAFDFLLLDRPLVFYRPDHDDYIAKSRPMIPGRDHYTVGPMTKAVEDLVAATDAAADRSLPDAYADKRVALRKELYDRRDGKAGDRFCKLVMKYLNE